MMAIFTEEELLTSNLTKVEKSEVPNVLDKTKVAKIEGEVFNNFRHMQIVLRCFCFNFPLAYILARFPNDATIPRIRDKIRYKLRDVRSRRKEEKSKAD